jgi:glyoxylase-like metal-dependent hydrolase (beta-lactamase superfamily II)
VPVQRAFEDRQEIDGLEIIHVPGHSPGHVVIRIGDILLCGDHILPRTIPQQWPERLAPYTGLGHYLDSLERIRRIEGLAVGLGGHEPPMRKLYQRIDEIRASHLRRLDRLLEIIAKAPHPLSIAEITRQMYSRQQGFYALLALFDVGARVEYLDQRGQLAIENLDEVRNQEPPVYRYRPA